VTHIHTAYGPPFYVDTEVFTLYYHDVQFNLFFFFVLLVSLTYSVFFCSVLFLTSLLDLTQATLKCFFISSCQTWSYTSISCHVLPASCKGTSFKM